MKRNSINILVAAFLLLLCLPFKSCKDDDFPVPTASSQADFIYVVEAFVADTVTGAVHFKANFTNRSLRATSYSWDFGNGTTSTEENPQVIYTSNGVYPVRLTIGSFDSLYYNRLVKTITLTLGKTVLFSEDFQDGLNDPLGEEWLPEGWITIDQDGDGFNWYYGVRQGVGTMRSQSYDGASGAALSPNNWLIIPELNFSSIGPGALITFRYSVGITASTPVYKQEHYGIFISEGSNVPENFTLLFEETMPTTTPNWEPQERMVDLSAYYGKIVYVAIRHFNVTDMDRLFVREVEVYKIE